MPELNIEGVTQEQRLEKSRPCQGAGWQVKRQAPSGCGVLTELPLSTLARERSGSEPGHGKPRMSHNPEIPLLGIDAKEIKTCPQKNLYTNIHSSITVLTIAKKQRQSECLSINEWINKMWKIYIMKYYPI